MARLPPRAVRGRLAASLWLLVLVALTVLLTVWVAGGLAARQERENVETRLVAGLRVAREEFADLLDGAELRAEQLARSNDVQRALAARDRAAADEVTKANADVQLVVGGTPLAGEGGHPVRREVAVTAEDGRMLGSVVVGIPLDEELAETLARAAGVVAGDHVALAVGGEITAASEDLAGDVPDDSAGSVELGDEAYRYASTTLLEGADVRLVALAPEAPIRAAEQDTRRRALLAALATLALVAVAAWTVGRLRRERRRRPPPVPEPERYGRRAGDTEGSRPASRRMRDAVALVGEALAATHDPEALLPVILQSAIEATGAAGARVVSDGREVARAGDPGAGGHPLSLPLGTEEDGMGRLLLHPPAGGSFDRDAEQLAHWLAAQASIALENERLHRTVKRQAVTDELTQLANRRRFTETLALEVRRAERFADPLALVLADLDDFKQINDRYGHGTGDEVLRRFADVLRANVRDFDLPVRFGGEEFAVLLPETGIDGAERLARRLASALGRLRIPEIGRDRAPVTASFGVASFPEAGSAEGLLSAADRALYRAKAEGKNRVVRAVPESRGTR